MVAEAILRDVDPRACNCRVRFDRGGESITVVAGLWDCPSHGSDKRRSLVEMCETVGAQYLLTLTFEQPREVLRGQLVTPNGYETCDRRTHVRPVKDRWGKSSRRWLTRATCVHCCRRVSRMMERFVKIARRQWGEFDYLKVIEDHKSGAMHLHLAVVGVPDDSQPLLAAAWRFVGGGRQVDLSPPRNGQPGGLGAYLGKYLGKRHDQKMAPGFRRWSRSKRFAPTVFMAWGSRWREKVAAELAAPQPVVQVLNADPAPQLRRVGWVHPEFRHIVTSVRLWAIASP